MGKIFLILEVIMKTLIGTYDCKLDAKGRLAFPMALIKQLDGLVGKPFVLKRSIFNPCIEVYPSQEWELMMVKMNKLNRFVKKNIDFIRIFSAGTKQIEVDANHRLLIGKELIEFSGINKEVVISSSINILEIWDKATYENSLISEQDFASLAEEVMQNIGEK